MCLKSPMYTFLLPIAKKKAGGGGGGADSIKNAGSMKKVTLILSFPYFWSDHKVRLYCT